MIGIAAASFVAIFAFDVPFPLIVLVRPWPGSSARKPMTAFRGGGGHGAAGGAPVADADTLLGDGTPDHTRSAPMWPRISAVFLSLWLLPVAALFLALGPQDVLCTRSPGSSA